MGAFPNDKKKWNEMLVFLLFLLLSFGFWFLQTLQEETEKQIELPLNMVDVPKGWIISSESAPVRIVLKDKGATLMYYYFWKPRFSTVDISLANVSASSDSTLVLTNRMLSSAMDRQLVSSTSIVSIEPNDITVKFERLGSKMVPVIPNLKVVTKQGFQISDSIIIENQMIKVYASRKILDRLDGIKTKPVTLNNATKTKEITTKLEVPEGVKVDSETVKMTVPIEEFTEKTFKLPVLCTDIPNGFILRIFPSTVDIVCSIPVSHFKELTEDLLEIRTPFQHFKDNLVTGRLPVKLTKKPYWLSNIKITPENVEFIIEQTNK